MGYIITIIIVVFCLMNGCVYIGVSGGDKYNRSQSYYETMNRCSEAYKDGRTIYGQKYLEEDYEAGAQWCISNIEDCKKSFGY